ncbi:MAG: TRAP transporter large permease [Dehalobacterium sp.]
MALLIGVFLFFLLLNMPIAFALATAPLVVLLVTQKLPLLVLTQQMFIGLDSFVFLAVPFFILAGNLMIEGGISQKLINASAALLDRLTGGLAMAVSFASMIFASLSGSGPATTAAIGGPTLPELTKRGYGREWSVALIACTGTIGPIIPPSITMVIYGAMANVSIGALFLAGIVPGVMIGAALMIMSYFHAKKVGVKPEIEQTDWKEVFKKFKDASWAFGMPLVILGGILGGIFTPTEAAVVSVVYALIVGFFIYHTLTIAVLPKIFKDTAVTTAVVMIILANAAGFAWLVSAERGPQQLIALFQSVTENKYIILLMINAFLFVLGCVMDTTSAMVMTVPALLPLAQAVGIDPLHLGLIVTINLVIGMATPPLGLTLFTACSVGKTSIAQVTRHILPMLAVMAITVLIITYFPGLVLWAPKLLMK